MKGEKVFLRAVEPTDLDVIFRWENDQENWLVSNTFNPFSKNVLEQYVFSAHDLMKDGQVRMMICSADGLKPVGAIDLFELDMAHRRVGVGILLDKLFRGKGMATEALQLLTAHCFDNLGLHQVFCNILAENAESIKLFTGVGFDLVGVKKDWLWHKGEWKHEHLYQLINPN